MFTVSKAHQQYDRDWVIDKTSGFHVRWFFSGDHTTWVKNAVQCALSRWLSRHMASRGAVTTRPY